MRKFLLSLCVTLFTLAAFAADKAAPNLTNISASEVNNDPSKPCVVLAWTELHPDPVGIEVQRKLFPFGWRKLIVIVGKNTAWSDRQPAKRKASYRIRAIYEDGPSEWSRVMSIKR